MSAKRYQIGGLCPRGGGHVWYFGDEDYDGSCGGKSWPLLIEVEPDDFAYLPDWVQLEAYDE